MSRVEMNGEITLYEYWLIVKKHRDLILKITAISFFIAALVAFMTAKTYKADTSFYYPLNSSQSSGGIAGLAQSLLGKGGMGSGADVAGGAAALLPGFSPSLVDYTKGILQSRTIADELIDKYNLMKYFHTTYRSVAEKALATATEIDMTKDGIMQISVITKDPQLSANLANGYVDMFKNYSSTNLISIAKKHRIDVQNQLTDLKKKLQDAEADMAVFQATHRTADFTEEAELFMKAYAQLRVQELATRMALQTAKATLGDSKNLVAEHLQAGANHPLVIPNLSDPILMSLRSQLASVYVKYAQAKATETPANPELQSYTEQVGNLESAVQTQLRRQVGAAQNGVADYLLEPEIKAAELTAKLSATQDGLKQMDRQFESYPTVGLQYVRKERNLKVLESLYVFLSSEFEKARLDEESEDPNLQVLDPAVVPDRKDGPHRTLDLLVGLSIGLLLGIFAAFFIEAMAPPVIRHPLPAESNGSSEHREPVKAKKE